MTAKRHGMPNHPQDVHPAFFGRRKGHRLRAHQSALMDELLPRIGLSIAAPFNALQLFGFTPSSVRLEIGFGGGEHLVAEALAAPETGFIGCEPYINGMAKVLALIEKTGAANIRLYAGDAAELIAWLPDASLQRIDLIHPDPWPKRRHWKRRFVQDRTLAAAARVLTSSAEFRFVTDIDDYAGWTLAHFFRARDFAWMAEQASDWREPWSGYTMTRYGAKAAREGRRAVYLKFRRR
jgi:tRNA (guanine-N7-)-methyltransferase